MLLAILLQYSHYIVTSQSIILLTILSLFILSPYNPSSSSPPIKLPTKPSFSLTNRHHRKPPHGYLTYPPPSVRLNRVHRHTGSHARHAYQLSPTIPLSSHTIPYYHPALPLPLPLPFLFPSHSHHHHYYNLRIRPSSLSSSSSNLLTNPYRPSPPCIHPSIHLIGHPATRLLPTQSSVPP